MPLQRAFQHSRYRAINLGQTGGVPTAEYAASENLDYDALANMFWKAVDTDCAALRRSAKWATAALASGETVRVTSGIGTDITFAVDDVPPRINCGRPDDNVVPPRLGEGVSPSGVVTLPAEEPNHEDAKCPRLQPECRCAHDRLRTGAAGTAYGGQPVHRG